MKTPHEQLNNERPMFYSSMIKPFLGNIRDKFLMKFGIFSGFFAVQVTGVFDLFTTPTGYYYTLILLVIADAVSKSINIVFTDVKKWNTDLFIRKTLYKCSIYFIVCVSFTAFSNQWETPDSNYVQYAAYAGLCGLELLSIARHHKIIGYLLIILKQVFTGKFDIEKIKKAASDYTLKNEEE